MTQFGEKIKDWSVNATHQFGKWVRGIDSMLGEALADWIAHEKREMAFREQNREVEEKLKNHDRVIQELVSKLAVQREFNLIEHQSRYQQTIRVHAVQIERLNRQLQEKEQVVGKCRLAIQQLMFKIDESKSYEDNLGLKINNQKEQLFHFENEKQELESKIIELQNNLNNTFVKSENEKRLEDQLKRAMNRIFEIKTQEREIHKKNVSYKRELQEIHHEKMILSEQIKQMERVRESLLLDKQKMLENLHSQEQKMNQILDEGDLLQRQLIVAQQDRDEIFESLAIEEKNRMIVEQEKEKINRDYDEMLAQWKIEKQKYEQKEKRLEKRLGRRIGNSIPHILVEPEFEKDYLELSEDEQSGVDAALYELSLGWHTGNVHFRPNSVKGKNMSFQEYGWGASHHIPGRLYVRKNAEGYRIYRISRTKDGSHRLSQKKIINWLKNQ